MAELAASRQAASKSLRWLVLGATGWICEMKHPVDGGIATSIVEKGEGTSVRTAGFYLMPPFVISTYELSRPTSGLREITHNFNISTNQQLQRK